MASPDSYPSEDLEKSWAQAKAVHSAEGYRLFLEKYPESQFVEQALAMLDQIEHDQTWEEAERRNDIPSYLIYRETYPEGPFAERASNRILDLIREGDGKINASSFRTEEEEALESAIMEDVLPAYNQFLRMYPDSTFIPEVRQRILQLEQKLNFQYQKIEEELAAWEYASDQHSILAYRDFLKQFPEGRFTPLAEDRIKSLEIKYQKKWAKNRSGSIEMPENLHRVRIAKGANISPTDTLVRNKQALILALLWLIGFGLMALLAFRLAQFLYPVCLIMALSTGAYLLYSRSAHLTAIEKGIYLFGGAVSIFFIVYGLTFLLGMGQGLAIPLSVLASGSGMLLMSHYLIRPGIRKES